MTKPIDLDEAYRDQLDDAARELQERIDRSVMMNLLEDIGWHRVDSRRIIENPGLEPEVLVWSQANKISCIGQDGSYVFKSKEDAVLFTLRWS